MGEREGADTEAAREKSLDPTLATFGSSSVADIAAMKSEMIAASAGPALGLRATKRSDGEAAPVVRYSVAEVSHILALRFPVGRAPST